MLNFKPHMLLFPTGDVMLDFGQEKISSYLCFQSFLMLHVASTTSVLNIKVIAHQFCNPFLIFISNYSFLYQELEALLIRLDYEPYSENVWTSFRNCKNNGHQFLLVDGLLLAYGPSV